jgi:YHS domain-containing protein
MSSKTQLNLLAFAALAGLVAAPISASANTTHSKKPVAVKLVCPVTGESIASVADAAGSSVYKGKKYYFCCSGCKPMFDKSPSKYIKTTASTNK